LGGKGREWTRGVMRLPYVRGKNIIAPLRTKPVSCEMKNRTNSKEAKADHFLKANS